MMQSPPKGPTSEHCFGDQDFNIELWGEVKDPNHNLEYSQINKK
jgi:hypothetical protein